MSNKIEKDRNKKSYIILSADNIILLENIVNQYIKKGYFPCGNIFIALGGLIGI